MSGVSIELVCQFVYQWLGRVNDRIQTWVVKHDLTQTLQGQLKP